MPKLIYASNMSLDGRTEDERTAFDWAPPGDETLVVRKTDSTLVAQSDFTADYASAWQAADKVVYLSTLAAPANADTRLERRFDPNWATRIQPAVSSALAQDPKNQLRHTDLRSDVAVRYPRHHCSRGHRQGAHCHLQRHTGRPGRTSRTIILFCMDIGENLS